MKNTQKQPITRVDTVWGKKVFVGVDDLNNTSLTRLLVRNQFGEPVKIVQSSSFFELAPKSIHRENLNLH